jgi:hypothetical protein
MLINLITELMAKRIRNKMAERFSNKQAEIVKGLVALAKENNLPLKKIMKTYEDFNRAVYLLDYIKTNDIKVYNPKLEDDSFSLTKMYIHLKKIEELKDFQKN